jgi:hypothetical protein
LAERRHSGWIRGQFAAEHSVASASRQLTR